MSEIIDRPDSFTRTAGRQLLLFALLSVGGIALLMVVLSWASSLTGSSAGASSGVDPATRTITATLREEPPQLNSTRATDQVSGMVLGHVMEGLLRYDENNQLAPGMAERWQIGERDATFWLRPDARWSNGDPVTAHDFVFAWRLVLDPQNASEYAFILYPIRNAEAINNGKLPVTALGVEALDERTLHVELERPIAYFDKLVAYNTYLPVQQAFYESTNGRYGADHDTLLYNGPFTITRWVHGAHVRMEKNPYYWGRDRIRIDVLDFPYITSDPNAILNLFKDRKIAYTTLTEENLGEALAQRWHLHRFMDGSVFFVEFNHRPGRITGNRNLRKAMQFALDPSELVYKVIKQPGYLPGESLFPIWLKGVEHPFRQEYPAPPRRFDPVEARRYLELARHELGLERFPPLVLLSGDNPVANKQAEYYQAALKKTLGLELRIDKQIFKQRLAKMLSGEFDLVLAGWGPDYDDPLTFGDLFASWNLNNRGRYSNPALDAQVRIAQNSLDPKTRMEAFAEIQRIIYDDAVILPDYERGLVYVTDPRMQQLVRRVAGPDPDFTSVWISGD
ncbi:MAG: peptide ABC transporter substrate-binding protein [Pseudomonadales bacterium]